MALRPVAETNMRRILPINLSSTYRSMKGRIFDWYSQAEFCTRGWLYPVPGKCFQFLQESEVNHSPEHLRHSDVPHRFQEAISYLSTNYKQLQIGLAHHANRLHLAKGECE